MNAVIANMLNNKSMEAYCNGRLAARPTGEEVLYRAFRRKGRPIVHIVAGNNIRTLRARRSLRIVNHSPTGFEWGYGGSGPAQLAMAMLLDLTNDRQLAGTLYQEFKWQFIHPARESGFTLAATEIRTWISCQQLHPHHG